MAPLSHTKAMAERGRWLIPGGRVGHAVTPDLKVSRLALQGCHLALAPSLLWEASALEPVVRHQLLSCLSSLAPGNF